MKERVSENLQDMALVVTGAASGIGRSTAEAAIRAGVKQILLSDINQPMLQSVAEDLSLDAEIETVAADLTEVTAAAEIIKSALSVFGRVDGLVNAAGITTRASILNGTSRDWDRIFAINARAPFLLMQAAINDMLSRKAAGSIVNIQSANVHCGTAELAIYSASKGALQTLTKNAANAHMRNGIRVNGVNLGWVLTEAEHHMQVKILGQEENWADGAASHTPLGRLLQPEEAANLILYLLDPRSAPLSGTAIDLTQEVVGAPF